jgi:hypothetical protein
MLFEWIFYASIWFIFPLLIASTLQGQTGWLTLWIYEIITIFCAGLCWLLADRFSWKNLSMLWWLLIGVWVVIFIVPTGNIYVSLLIGGVLIAIGNNMIFWASSHILEKTDHDHKEDGSFVALQRIVENIGFVIMPVILWIVIENYSLQTWLEVLVGVILGLALYNIVFTRKKN